MGAVGAASEAVVGQRVSMTVLILRCRGPCAVYHDFLPAGEGDRHYGPLRSLPSLSSELQTRPAAVKPKFDIFS